MTFQVILYINSGAVIFMADLKGAKIKYKPSILVSVVSSNRKKVVYI